MGFEYVYAYLENLEIFFHVGTAGCAFGLAFFIWARYNNDIDRDDWMLMMAAFGLGLLLFIVLDLSPSMEHIQRVRTTVTTPYVEPKSEVNNEIPKLNYYPGAYCVNSVTCR